MQHGLETLLIGRTLAGRYEIEAIIGRGGMSVVLRARDLTLGRPVAVKVIALPAHSAAAKQRLRERFRREAAAAAGIPPHPNVVHVYDYGTDPELDLDFLVMELLRGRDLKAAIAHSALTRPQALRVLLEAARGLAAGHRAGIVHRDVKPANIFLIGEEKLESVRVLDFGIAKALEAEDDLTQADEAPPHSPAYASPEQLAPSRPISAASDVYQLGLVGYEVLAGERPFSEAERERLSAGEVVPLPVRGVWASVPEGIRRVIERAQHPDPAVRYPDAAAFAEALASASGQDAARPPSPPYPPPSAAAPQNIAAAWEERTVLETPAPSATGRAAGSPGVPIAPARRRPTSYRGGHAGKPIRIGALVLLLATGVWGVARLAGGGAGGTAEAGAAELDLQALEREFREMQHGAALALLEGETFGDATTEADAAAAAQVQLVIADRYRSWAEGDIQRHVAHYADRVDIADRRRVRRSALRRERRRERERFDEVQISIDRQLISFPEPGRALALVDRRWDMRSAEARWQGAARQEFILEWQQGRWRIIAEDEVEVYRSDCTGC